MSKSRSTTAKPAAKKPGQPSGSTKESHGRAIRETVESIAVAVVLAFLFRAFVAEAFVIPTGSMAPTLQGRHMDVACGECGYRYRTGASVENDGPGQVVATACPLCGYVMELDKRAHPNQRSFSGDRILVSKFAYEIAEPERWDVIVFKFPGNAKQNYIKRLVGLPNETIRIRHGDIYTRPTGPAASAEADFQIARKPPHKLKAMLQLVHDTDYQAPRLIQAGWPLRWQDWDSETPTWLPAEDGGGFRTVGAGEEVAWLRYRHVLPSSEDWGDIRAGRRPRTLLDDGPLGQLITDYYAYNDGMEQTRNSLAYERPVGGLHWVGDLALEAVVEVSGETGKLLLDLVEGGVHYTCQIDVATGEAILSIDGGRGSFVDAAGGSVQHPVARTKLRGPGSYRLRFANVDDELTLWVNRAVVPFEGPTTYRPASAVQPRWSPTNPGDLEPAGVGAQGLPLTVTRLRVFRDVYYVATNNNAAGVDYKYYSGPSIREVLTTPQLWETSGLFDARRDYVEFRLGEDSFFPLGDNSPQSRDARLWSDGGPPYGPPHFVRRDLLTGKALLIYWPHPWNAPIPFFPNFQRMGLIR